VVKWLEDNGVPVDPSKTELLKTVKGAKVDSAPVTLRGHPEAVVPKQYVRYLRVWLDPRLRFKVHTQKVVERG